MYFRARDVYIEQELPRRRRAGRAPGQSSTGSDMALADAPAARPTRASRPRAPPSDRDQSYRARARVMGRVPPAGRLSDATCGTAAVDQQALSRVRPRAGKAGRRGRPPPPAAGCGESCLPALSASMCGGSGSVAERVTALPVVAEDDEPGAARAAGDSEGRCRLCRVAQGQARRCTRGELERRRGAGAGGSASATVRVRSTAGRGTIASAI